MTDGRLEIDNNLVENAIRSVALYRKNYLFAGSRKRTKRTAAIYTLVANSKLCEVEPFVYSEMSSTEFLIIPTNN